MIYISILLSMFLAGMEVDLFIPSFPELIHTFNLTPVAVQLTVSVNFLSYCISSLYVGAMGDRFGKRPVILWGLIIFILGSLFCVVASTFPLIVLGRFLQGIGMAAPCVLSFIVIMDITAPEKQAGRMGIMNGVITGAMAFAPVIGSFIAMHYGYRGNFMVLFVLSIAAFFMNYFFLPETGLKNPNVRIQLKTYLPLLKSREYVRFFLIICLIVTGYWTFIAMGPILFMESMGVPLSKFGFYQGAVLALFSTTSLLSPFVMKHVNHDRCLRFSFYGLLILSFALLIVSLFCKDTPWIITLLMSLYVVPFVFPVNILYPKAVGLLENAQGKAAALINFGRLAFSAIGVEGVSYAYTGRFFPLALFIMCLTITGFALGRTSRAVWGGKGS